ncbi:MAG: hypothetical protein WDW38_003214 [Sanguina aurantia]
MNEPGKSKEVTTKQVRAVRFSVYSEEEVKKLSVVRILQPITRNALKEPVPQGLYDTAMGPVDKTSTCSTCGLLPHACPGHFGHIELPLPVYNPLLLVMMHRLVRCTCLFCFHLKLQQPQVEKYEARFKQLAFGDLAAGIETHVAKTFTHKLLGGFLDHDMDEEEYASKSHAAPQCKQDSKVSFTQHALEATQDTLTTFWASCSTKAKCMNCGATNPSIRKFGTKLFMVWSSPKALVTNAMNNHVMPNLLDEGVSVIADMESQVAAEISKQASARATVRERRKRGLPVDQKSGRQAADDDSADPVDRMMEEAMAGQEDEELYKDEGSDAEDEMGIKAGVVSAPGGALGFEHIQNASYIKILNACLDINTTVSEQNQAYTNARLAATEIDPTSLAIATAKQDLGRVIARWLELQNSVCELMDTSTTEKKTDALGIRQQIEKKEGLFRKNMMGKRVNFAARSVISPDPYIGTGEIGVPPYFAKRLTFAERVTPFNVERLRQAVINGHAVHPGALSVEMENGVVTHLEKLSKQKREAIAKQLLVTTTGGVMSGRQRLLSLGAAATGKQVATSAAAPQTSKIVYRHLQDGDVMLTNRQPTLHKPARGSIRRVSHVALTNARAPGFCVTRSGLIQDHVVSGTLLAKRDTFFTRQEYSQLLFVGCTVWTSKAQGGTSQAAMQLDPPTLLKPRHMWTGKQVIAGVIRFFTRHAGEPLTFIAGSKVPAAYWGLHSGEDELELLNGYLLRGCIDKNQFGKYGLVHAVQELYGGTAAGQLLSAFSRLFTCLPTGQVKAFPANCLSLMTISGAKGSLVNFSQISCLLGQQELEGRRVPRMSSGKTLPCFRAFDGGARSCGFVGDRFLTGLRPQEYYFHCMAGREGLVDTTVKTSRSGYLQRCMIKNLESLRVHYDNTVRDNADGSVVQMFYGEDGVDVMNINYMSKFEFLAKNAVTFARRLDLPNALLAGKTACLEEAEAEIAAAIRERTALRAKAAKAQRDGKLKLAAKTVKQLSRNPPVSALQPPTVMGATSEKFADALAKFLHDNAGGLLASTERTQDILTQPAVAGRHGVHPVSTETFQQLMQLKYMRSLAAPGEAVGVIAAQSVGEPSTQMTLNTFHMAGRGEANVTLGIPRLREILMAAAKRIRTPVMTVPLLPGLGVQAAGVLAGRMRKLLLAECVSGISVEETPVAALDHAAGSYGRRYRVTLHFYSEDKYPAEAKLSHRELAFCFMKTFCPALQKEVDKESKRTGSASIGKVDVADLDEELQLPDGGADDEEAAAAEASRSKKKKASKEEAFEDFEGDEELREGKLRFRGGRGESASYAPADDEDEEDNRAAAKEEDTRQAAAWAAASHEQPAGDEEAAAGEGAEEEEEEEGEGEETTEAAAKGKKSGSKRGSGGKDGKRRKVTPRAGKAEAAVPVLDLDMKLSGYDGEEGDTDMVSQTGPHSEQSCSVTLTMPLSAPKLLMLELVERIAAATPVRVTKGIERVYVIEPNASEAAKCQTDGITFPGVWAHSDIVNVNGITTNDVHAMLTTYGVEAARGTLMHEVQSVFAAYGIGVDPRHLSLIADFMTHQGGYRACNRIGISSCVSPLLKMSFETAAAFLTDATLKGSVDDLRSPAARLVVGRVVELGTGVMDLLHDC